MATGTHLPVLDNQVDLLLRLARQVSLDNVVGAGGISDLRVERGTRNMRGHVVSSACVLNQQETQRRPADD